jgi:hypothetical protein
MVPPIRASWIIMTTASLPPETGFAAFCGVLRHARNMATKSHLR